MTSATQSIQPLRAPQKECQWLTTISTPEYLLDQAKRRLTPSINNFPGMRLRSNSGC